MVTNMVKFFKLFTFLLLFSSSLATATATELNDRFNKIQINEKRAVCAVVEYLQSDRSVTAAVRRHLKSFREFTPMSALFSDEFLLKKGAKWLTVHGFADKLVLIGKLCTSEFSE